MSRREIDPTTHEPFIQEPTDTRPSLYNAQQSSDAAEKRAIRPVTAMKTYQGAANLFQTAVQSGSTGGSDRLT